MGHGLWLLVLATMSLDIVSTVMGLSVGLVELNPIAAVGLEAVGVAVLPALKIPAIVIGIVGWRTLPKQYRRLNLVGLALPWLAAVATNSWLLLVSI